MKSLKTNQLTKIVNEFYLNKINLTSSAQEKATIESLALAVNEITDNNLSEDIYLVLLI